MNRVEITQQLLPIYLVVVLLLQIPLQTLSVLAVLVPLAVVSFGLYRKKRSIGSIGMVGYILISLPQLTLLFMDDFVRVFLLVFFVGLPSILLLSKMLQVEHTKTFWFPAEKKKPLVIALVLLALIFIVFYGAAVLLQGDFLFSTTTSSGQVFLLTAISILLCVPLLLK